MAKKRVHEIAKERDIPSKDVLAALQKAGLEVTTASSSVDEAEAAKVLGNGASAAKAPAKATKAAAKDDAKAKPKADGAKAEAKPAAEAEAEPAADAEAEPAADAEAKPAAQAKGKPAAKGDAKAARPQIQRPPTPDGEVKRAGPEGRGPRILQEAPPPEPPRPQGGQAPG